jgi:shikimate kinase / 3-dehydroquinate synthase
MKNIILTGFMGTGKTTVGRLLAERDGRRFVDTDEWIATQTGLSVAEIFRQEGESRFRQLEAAAALELAGQEGLVIATGGRFMLDPANALDLGRNAHVFCLTAAPDEILARLRDEIGQRPMLAGADAAGQIRRLLLERAEGYGQFAQVETSGKTAAAVAAEILARTAAGEGANHLLSPTRLPVQGPDGRYDVIVGHDLLSRVGELAAIGQTAVVISDETVGPLYATHLRDLPPTAAPILLPAGEPYKTLASVQMIYGALLAAGLDRHGVIVALGGGVIGDMAGFAAATYLRGVAFVQCPTTLLAMVDASIGGKTGVDLPQGKNLVGAFKQPQAVIADLETLTTLPAVEIAAGLAEVVKSGLIAAPAILKQLETGAWLPAPGTPRPNYHSLCLRAIQVKRDIVAADPYEAGVRAHLNLGHTFGHAIEQVSGYRVRHGEAVAIGLVAAAHLSARLGHADTALQQRLEALLTRLRLPVRIPADLAPEALLRAMGSDKKKASGRLRFVLLRGVGAVFVTADVPQTAVLATLRALAQP